MSVFSGSCQVSGNEPDCPEIKETAQKINLPISVQCGVW